MRAVVIYKKIYYPEILTKIEIVEVELNTSLANKYVTLYNSQIPKMDRNAMSFHSHSININE